MKKTLQILLPLLLACGLLWLTLRGLPWAEVTASLSQAHWGLVLLSLVPTVIAHFARAQRWRLLLEPVAEVPTLMESFSAVMAGYLANLALPRAGEVARCTLLARRRAIPVEVSLGTVIAERAFDVVLLGLVTGLAFLLQFDELLQFFQKLIAGKESASTEAKGGGGLLLYAAFFGLAVLLAGWALRKRLARIPLFNKVLGMVSGLLSGIFSALRLKSRTQFLALTLLIWGCYYLSGWICLEALPALSGIGPLAALMIFTVGSFGMVAPVQGGYGPFEFMVIAGLTQLYGHPEAVAAASAILMHNSQTALSILVGAPCLAWLAMGKIKSQPQSQAQS